MSKGGSDSPPKTYTAPLDSGEWDSLDFEARKQFMRDMVMPTMRPLFQEFDATRFAALSCGTCHGTGVSGDFALPTADLPALSSQALMNPEESQKPMLDFMRNVVKTRMSELLGHDPADFKCSACHMSAP